MHMHNHKHTGNKCSKMLTTAESRWRVYGYFCSVLSTIWQVYSFSKGKERCYLTPSSPVTIQDTSDLEMILEKGKWGQF